MDAKKSGKFTQVKKKTDKLAELMNQFEELKDQDSDDEHQEKTLHENVDSSLNIRFYIQIVGKYMKENDLEKTLLKGLMESISGDLIPKNPWCEIQRALGTENLKKEL